MSEELESIALPPRNHGGTGSLRILSDGILVLFASFTLGFLLWNLAFYGAEVRESDVFKTRSERLFLLVSMALVPGIASQVREAWREGFERQDLPREGKGPSFEERSFRTRGPGQSLIRHCVEQVDQRFRLFYAFHRYQPPYVAYFYYAKKGSLSLLGFPLMRMGFLLFFLACTLSLFRGDPSALQGWEWVMLGTGVLLVLSGLVIRLGVSYRKFWVRIAEENNRVCLTLSCSGRWKRNWLEGFCNSLDAQVEVVSCSTHSR